MFPTRGSLTFLTGILIVTLSCEARGESSCLLRVFYSFIRGKRAFPLAIQAIVSRIDDINGS